MAKKTGMAYLKSLTIFQFSYMTEKQKKALLIDYQQYISLEHPITLKRREEWFLNQLEKTSKETLPSENTALVLDEVIDKIEDNRLELDELRLHLDNYDDK